MSNTLRSRGSFTACHCHLLSPFHTIVCLLAPVPQGIWVAPDIDNPDYEHDDALYHFKDTKYVGFELWQVKAGSIFDNILVADSYEEAEKFANDTWAKTKDGEKEMHDKVWSLCGGMLLCLWCFCLIACALFVGFEGTLALVWACMSQVDQMWSAQSAGLAAPLP